MFLLKERTVVLDKHILYIIFDLKLVRKNFAVILFNINFISMHILREFMNPMFDLICMDSVELRNARQAKITKSKFVSTSGIRTHKI